MNVIEPVRIGDDVTLYHADCLDVMREMEPGSVDAVITDLPYFEVVKAVWDNQWETRNDYI